MINLGKCRNWSSRHFLWRILNSSNRASATFKHLASEFCQIKCHQELLILGVILEVLWHWQRQGYDILQLFLDLPNQGLSKTSGDRQRVQPIKLKIIKIEKTFCSPEHYHYFASAFTIFHFDQFSIDIKRYYFPSLCFVKCLYSLVQWSSDRQVRGSRT